MPTQGLHALPAVRIPHEQLPSTAATTGQAGAIRTPHHARDRAIMPLQPLKERSVGGLPQAHAAIIATAGKPRAVPTPGHATDPGRVRAANPAAYARCYIP